MPDIKIIQQNKQIYLLNQQQNCLFEEKLFDLQWLQQQKRIFRQAPGRAQAYMFNWKNRQWVLKKYCRGGLPARISRDRYWHFGIKKSRVYREMALLIQLQKKQLPVSNPCLAQISRQGLAYQAAMISEYIPGSVSLAQCLMQDPLASAQWQQVGMVIAQLHQHQVCHADLNARNILFSQGKVFVIDFDRATIKRGQSWKKANLQRLKRSLLKIAKQQPWFFFNEQDWQFLMEGYHI